MEYWKEVGSFIVFIVMFIAGRRSRDFKTKTQGADAIGALQKVYDKYIEHNAQVTEEITKRVNSLEEHNRNLQKNFNDMSLSYAVVMGESKKFEEQYRQLQKEYEKLKIDHDRLKSEFDKYKKLSKLNEDSLKNLKKDE